MPIVKGCNLPDHLLYDVENHIWFQEQGDGTVKLGMTSVATAMAGTATERLATVSARDASRLDTWPPTRASRSRCRKPCSHVRGPGTGARAGPIGVAGRFE